MIAQLRCGGSCRAAAISEHGRTCRRLDRRGRLADEPFTVKVRRDKVLVELRGRPVRTLVGADADEIRRAIGADAAVDLLVARKTGNFKHGNER